LYRSWKSRSAREAMMALAMRGLFSVPAVMRFGDGLEHAGRGVALQPGDHGHEDELVVLLQAVHQAHQALQGADAPQGLEGRVAHVGVGEAAGVEGAHQGVGPFALADEPGDVAGQDAVVGAAVWYTGSR